MRADGKIVRKESNLTIQLTQYFDKVHSSRVFVSLLLNRKGSDEYGTCHARNVRCTQRQVKLYRIYRLSALFHWWLLSR